MSGSQRDDADHLAAYAEKMIAHAKEALRRSATARMEAKTLLVRARVAIGEAKAQLK